MFVLAKSFPWGANTKLNSYGLSYTTLVFSDLVVTVEAASLDISNSGDRAGAETVQLYIAPDKAAVAQPAKELKGFLKVHLEPGERRRVGIPFDRFSIASWDQELHVWKREKGNYRVLIGASSSDIRLVGSVEVLESTTWTGP